MHQNNPASVIKAPANQGLKNLKMLKGECAAALVCVHPPRKVVNTAVRQQAISHQFLPTHLSSSSSLKADTY